ncbi:MAG: hypothetical protein ACRDE2_00915 [Chitinophagaceae bacterium]
MKTVLNTPYVHFALNDQLLIATFKKGLHINLDAAREIVHSRLEFTENKTVSVLILNQGVACMDKEARDYLSSEEGTRNLKAVAMVLRSTFGSMLGNFFLSVNKPEMPVRIFSNEKPAMKWLYKFIS